MKDRRSISRMLCADLVKVSWHDSEGARREVTGNLEDISVHGLSLQLEMPIDREVPVSITVGLYEFSGIVRYCYYREIGYFLGVEFAGSSWSPEGYRPQHLLDLQKLLGGFDARAEAAANQFA